MRTMEVSVVGKDIKCVPDTLHVPPHYYENIAVHLHDDWVEKYELNVNIRKDKSNALTVQRINSATVIVTDDNRAPATAKFEIDLKPLPESKAATLKPLDPHVVND